MDGAGGPAVDAAELPSHLADSDDDFAYEEVDVGSDHEDDISEDLDAALRSLQTLTNKDAKGTGGSGAAAAAAAAAAAKPQASPGQVTRRPEVIDDFIRNFFVRMGLQRTSDVFEAEWYELKAAGQLPGGNTTAPDIYQRHAELEEEVASMRLELAAAQEVAGRASGTWDKFRKERDYHRMHHKRVAQEKNKLINDIKQLKTHYAKYEPTILELRKKYELAMKEKMLMGIERDKMATKLQAVQQQLAALQGDGFDLQQQQQQMQQQLGAARSRSPSPGRKQQHSAGSMGPGSPARSPHSTQRSAQRSGSPGPSETASRNGQPPSPWPLAGRYNPAAEAPPLPAQVASFALQKSFKGHLLGVASLVMHPTKPILVTASDDKTWKMWHLPAGDLIMCGEGHKDWVAGVEFHPSGTSLASSSGDSTVKIWSFEKQKCVATFTEHKQAVWAVACHDQGDWLASSSLDRTVRLWDLNQGRCRQVLRGHADSVNEVHWQPCGSAICTASSDKTVSVWDPRSGLPTQTFYGHRNSVNQAMYNLQGSSIASCDADGVVKLWDVRMVAEILTIAASPYPANKASWDASGMVLAIPSDDGKVRCCNTRTGEVICELVGHEDAVQGAVFDPAGQFLATCSSDNTFKLWN